MQKILKISLFAALVAAAMFAALSFAFISWNDDGSEDYAGGVILRDAAGEVMRVSLGEGDVDCRPYYVANENDWIVKALVASEDGEFWSHHGVRPLSIIRASFQNLFYRRRISGASTITVPFDIPLISRFLTLKACSFAGGFGGNSVITAPPYKITLSLIVFVL